LSNHVGVILGFVELILEDTPEVETEHLCDLLTGGPNQDLDNSLGVGGLALRDGSLSVPEAQMLLSGLTCSTGATRSNPETERIQRKRRAERHERRNRNPQCRRELGQCSSPTGPRRDSPLPFRGYPDVGLRKIDEEWVVLHEHHSIPARS
jgi:hypothetical protein